MRALKKYSTTLVASCLFSTLTIAATTSQSNISTTDYTVSLLNDCQLVGQYPMTEDQVKAYLSLQQAEIEMQGLEEPIKAIEQEISQYSEKIEQLTKLAIQETSTSLHIDKKYLKKQEAVVEKLNSVMAKHQADFDALGEQGDLIGKIADEFSKKIKSTINNVEYDQIHVNDPDKPKQHSQCYRNSLSL